MEPPRLPPMPVAPGSAPVAADPSGAVAIAALDLGVAAEALQAQIAVGDLLAAEILAPQGGFDLIEILGRQVVAQLPPGVRPGETLLLQVSAFAGNQILVRNFGLLDPNGPPATVTITLPPASPQTATLVTAANAPPARAAEPPISPPRAVFVAAAVRPAPLTPPAAPAPPAPEQTARTVRAAELRVQVDPLEARIAASRTARSSAPGPAVPVPATSLREPPVPPRMTVSSVPPRAPAQRSVPGSPEGVLESLRVPRTPVTLAAVRMLSVAAARLPDVLARLESLLPGGGDARVSALRPLVGFIARLNPADERAFPQQISAYVGNVIEGFEAKLASALRAHAAAAEQLRSPSPAMPPVVAQAKAAERSAAAQNDMKALVLALVRQPVAQQSPALAQALNETLTMLTAVQLDTLAANARAPDTIVLTLPVFFHTGGQPATVRISRDTPNRKEKLDADTFHVAFVLDTASLGTVAVDLESAGRSVRVNVKTERQNAADRFGTTFGELRGRLERLHYRVASVDAAVASRRSNVSAPPRDEPLSRSSAKHLDLHA